ncbi:MAG: CBS domain-containing protein, partial [Phycisphaerales bacterium]
MIALDRVQTSDTEIYVDELPAFFQTGLQVRDVMSKAQFVVSAECPVLTVAQIMTTHQAPFVAVEEGGRMVAVVTEREIAQGAARHGSRLRDMKAGEIMMPFPAGISPDCPLTEAAQVMHTHRLRWFPVVANQDVISILTQADLTRAATLLPELGTVASVMSEDIITIDAERLLLEAAQTMTDRDISCLVATHLGKLAGVLTEADILDQVVASELPWSAITVADVMTFPVVSVESGCSLSEARAVMDRTHVHRLIVVDRDRPRGLITQTDITRALNNRLQEQEHQRWRRLANSHNAIFAVDLDA